MNVSLNRWKLSFQVGQDAVPAVCDPELATGFEQINRRQLITASQRFCVFLYCWQINRNARLSSFVLNDVRKRDRRRARLDGCRFRCNYALSPAEIARYRIGWSPPERAIAFSSN